MSPLNRPEHVAGTYFLPHGVAEATFENAVRVASTEAFHLAMLVSVAMLLAGAAVNAWGIRSLPAGEGAGTAADAGAAVSRQEDESAASPTPA